MSGEALPTHPNISTAFFKPPRFSRKEEGEGEYEVGKQLLRTLSRYKIWIQRKRRGKFFTSIRSHPGNFANKPG
ncbi:MAG TPA: hypothetical protein VGH02_01460, partial [Rhizomicrobium sp.]